MRYGSRSNTKKRTVKIKGSVRLALLTVRQKNGTVKKTENGTDTVGYGTDTVRYGTDTVTYSDPLLYWIRLEFLIRFN